MTKISDIYIDNGLPEKKGTEGDMLKSLTRDMDSTFIRVMDYAMRMGYREEENPLFLMEAYLEHRRHKSQVPEWILEYFDRVATGFMKEAERRCSSKKKRTRDAFLIKDIMEMKSGQGDSFTHYADLMKRIYPITSIVRDLAEKHPELLKPRKRNDFIEKVVELYNHALPDSESEWITAANLDKWLPRPLSEL